MDKAEYRAKLDEINALADAGDYEGAAKAVDEVDWRRVKSVRTLCMVGEIYEVNGRLDDSRRVLEIAYRRSPDSKTVIYRLSDLCIRLGDFDAALDYFTEFSEISPTDCSKYILKYKLYRARKSPIEDQIAILEQYKEGEFTERWAYELARLYSQAGNKAKCIEVCDDIILWFGEGKYVTKAMELKMQYTSLSPSQQIKYQESMQKLRTVSRMGTSAAKVSSAYPDEDDERPDGSDYTGQAMEKINATAGTAVAGESILRRPHAGTLNMSKMADPAQMQSQLADSIRQVFSGLNQRGSVQENENLAFAEEDEVKVYKPLKEDLSNLKIRELEPEQLGAEEVPVAGMARAIVETAPADDEQIAGQMSLMDFAEPEDELDLEALFAETSNILAQEVATGAFVKTDDSLESKLAAEDAAVRKAAEEEAARRAAEEAVAHAHKAAEEEVARKAEEEAARKAAEEEAARQAAEEAARKAAEEEAARQAAEEAARKAEEEAARKAAEEAARKAAEEEAARQAAEEAARKAEEEEAARKAAEKEEAARQAAEEEAARKAAEEAAREAAEEEAVRKAAEEDAARKTVEEEAARQAAEEVASVEQQLSYEKETDESLGITRQFNFQEELKKAQQTEEELFAAELAKSIAELRMGDAEEIQPEIQETQSDVLEEPVQEAEAAAKELMDDNSVLIEEITEEKAALTKGAVKDSTAATTPPVSEDDELTDLEKALMSISFEEEEPTQELGIVQEKEIESKEAIDDIEDFLLPADEPKRLSFLPVEPRPFNDDEKKIFTYFTTIPGMSQQITEALADVHNNAGDKTSRSGNILLIGRQGSGKTRLCDAIVLAICKDLGIEAAKVAKVIGRDFNRKDPAMVVSKLSGGFLIIEGAGEMTKDTAGKLSQAMEFRTDSLVVMLEDEKMDLKNMLAKNPELAEKFTSSIKIPVFTNDELVTFAKTYANELGYKMDEMGILALYTMIGDNQKDAEPITVAKVKAMIDKAIERANKGARKFGRKLSKKATDDDNLIILYEKDFDFDIN